MTTGPECKDCKRERERRGDPLPKVLRRIQRESGGRCASHWLQVKRERKGRAHENRVISVYGLKPGDYERLYLHQGGVCALCRRSTGATKNLAVDHDHGTGLAQGLLCGPCNKDVMGWSRRQVEYFQRCIEYLENPPARQLGIVAIHKDNR